MRELESQVAELGEMVDCGKGEVESLEGKLKSAVEQVKLLEDLRDKMSGDLKSIHLFLVCLERLTTGEYFGVTWDGIIPVPEQMDRLTKIRDWIKARLDKQNEPARKPFAIEVGKCYLAQNSVKWWIVAEAKDANGKTIYSGIARELMRHSPPMAWFYGDGQAVHSMNSSLQPEVK